MQRVDGDEDRAPPRGGLAEVGQGGEVADPLIALASQGIELGRKSEDSPAFQQRGRQIAAARGDRQTTGDVRQIFADDPVATLAQGRQVQLQAAAGQSVATVDDRLAAGLRGGAQPPAGALTVLDPQPGPRRRRAGLEPERHGHGLAHSAHQHVRQGAAVLVFGKAVQ